MNDEYSDLNIQRRGEHFVLVKTIDGQTTEIELLESEILALARTFPSYARILSARKVPPGSGIGAWVAIPLKQFTINSDLHDELVLLRLTDTNNAEFDFSAAPTGMRELGKALIQWADKVESRPKTTKQ